VLSFLPLGLLIFWMIRVSVMRKKGRAVTGGTALART